MSNMELSDAYDEQANSLMDESRWERQDVAQRLRSGLAQHPVVYAITSDGQKYALRNFDREADTVELGADGYTLEMSVGDLELHFDAFEMYDVNGTAAEHQSGNGPWMRSSFRQSGTRTPPLAA